MMRFDLRSGMCAAPFATAFPGASFPSGFLR
jgi:hypothetical protein